MSFPYPDLAVSSVDDLDRVFDAIASVDAIGVKVPIEHGFGPKPIFRIHPREVREAIVRKAAGRNLPIYVHASDETEQSIALDMGAHALMHLNFAGVDPSPAFMERVARLRPYVVTTFSILDAEMTRWHPERLDDRLVRVAVPAEELRSAHAPEMWAASDRADVAFVYPWLPAFIVRLLAAPPSEEQRPGVLAVNLRAAKRLYDAGVPLVIGSDAGNSSVLSEFHGTSTLRELELLADAGIPLPAVLAAATRVPARMLGIEADAGTVEPGKRGDLAVLRDDPLRDVRAFRTIEWTVQAGVAHTPREWMSLETTR
jgi:imidazolonepropionase-like amidohydrolase